MWIAWTTPVSITRKTQSRDKALMNVPLRGVYPTRIKVERPQETQTQSRDKALMNVPLRGVYPTRIKVERPKKLSLTGTCLKRKHYQWDAGEMHFSAVWLPEG